MDPETSKALRNAIGIADLTGRSVVGLEEFLHCVRTRKQHEHLGIVLGESSPFDAKAYVQHHTAYKAEIMYPPTTPQTPDVDLDPGLVISRQIFDEKRTVSKLSAPKLIQRGLVTRVYKNMTVYDREMNRVPSTKPLGVTGQRQPFTDWTYRTICEKNKPRMSKPMPRRESPPKTKLKTVTTMQKRLDELRHGYLKPRSMRFHSNFSSLK